MPIKFVLLTFTLSQSLLIQEEEGAPTYRFPEGAYAVEMDEFLAYEGMPADEALCLVLERKAWLQEEPTGTKTPGKSVPGTDDAHADIICSTTDWNS